jgi:plasmid maintenance system antidote protein VapI
MVGDSRYFGNSAKFWLGLQNNFNLEEEGSNKKVELNNIMPIIKVRLKA